MRKIKVVMLALYSPPSKHNGLGMHINKITEYLSYRNDVEVHVITIGDKDRRFKKGDLNVHVIKKKSLPYPFSIPNSVWSLRHKTIKLNPDIVHAEGTAPPYSTTAALLRNRYPILLTAPVIAAKEVESYSGMKFILGMLVAIPNARYVVSKISHIIAQSSYTKNRFSEMTN